MLPSHENFKSLHANLSDLSRSKHVINIKRNDRTHEWEWWEIRMKRLHYHMYLYEKWRSEASKTEDEEIREKLQRKSVFSRPLAPTRRTSSVPWGIFFFFFWRIGSCWNWEREGGEENLDRIRRLLFLGSQNSNSSCKGGVESGSGDRIYLYWEWKGLFRRYAMTRFPALNVRFRSGTFLSIEVRSSDASYCEVLYLVGPLSTILGGATHSI